MKPNFKFIRVVLGSTVGALLWAGCASDRDVSHEPAGANINIERGAVLDRQMDLSKWRSDTHPEWRTGWNMAFPNPPGDASVDDVGTALEQPFSQPPQSR